MLHLLVSCLFTLLLTLVFGNIFAKVTKISFDFFDTLLLGLIFLTSISAWLSIIIPIDFVVKSSFLIFGILGLFIFREKFKSYLKVLLTNKTLLITLPFFIIGLIVASNAPLNYDSPLYHIQSIKWIQEYRVVPGLANLHYRFGYNSNIFILFALTSFNDVFGQQTYSVNFFLFCFAVGYFIFNSYQSIQKKVVNVDVVIQFILLYYILKNYDNLSSPSPDYIVFVVPLVLISTLIKSKFKSGFRQDKFYLLMISLTFLITVKLSIVPFFLFIPLIGYYNPNLMKSNKKLLLSVFLVLLPWLIRNVILTGWLVFPFSKIDLFNIDWKVPIADVIVEKNTIISWARIPGRLDLNAVHLSITEWFPYWWANINFSDRIYFITAILAPLVALSLPLFTKAKYSVKYNAIIIIVFICFSYWFFLAPAFRFGLNYIYILIVAPLFYMDFTFLSKLGIKKVFYYVLMLICLINFLRITLTHNKQLFFNPRLISQKQIQVSKEERFLKFKLKSIIIYLPSAGDRCYDFCLPCSHKYMNLKNLKQRGSTLQDGFQAVSN